jgi:hypothetical protein
MSRENSVPDLPKNKKPLNSWKSVIVPSLLILMLFFEAGILMINSLSSFYYKERIQEASLLAKSYAGVLSTVIDAEHQLDLQMHSTLKVAGVTVSKYVGPITNSLLSTMVDNLDIDVTTHARCGKYIGWATPKDHPVHDSSESTDIFRAEKIRADTESGTCYKYGYYRFDDGKMVQVGVLASNIEELYAQIEPQYIIDRLSKDATHTRPAFLDPGGLVPAATDPSLWGFRA